jgi:transcriptional regulator with XRE-family HTH domain
MAEPTTLGTWLRRERERRGVSLTAIADQTKLSIPLLQGLEADDLSRWPGGIFRRAFARSYATAIGVDPDLVVRRLEEEHPSEDAAQAAAGRTATAALSAATPAAARATQLAAGPAAPRRVLLVAATLDLLLAGAIGFGFAAANARLLWPVLAIAAYHAVGLLLTGRSPMLALLLDQGSPRVVDPGHQQTASTPAESEAPAARPDRAPATGAARTATARLRQPGRRGTRGSRGRAVN